MKLLFAIVAILAVVLVCCGEKKKNSYWVDEPETVDSFQPSWGVYTSTGGKISTGFQVAPNMFVDTNSGGITFGYGF